MSLERKKQSRLKGLRVKCAKWRRQSATLTKGASNCHRELLYTHIAEVFTQKGIISYLNTSNPTIVYFLQTYFLSIVNFFPRASVLAAALLASRAQRVSPFGGQQFCPRGGEGGRMELREVACVLLKGWERKISKTHKQELEKISFKKTADPFPLQSFGAHFRASFDAHWHCLNLLHRDNPPPPK